MSTPKKTPDLRLLKVQATQLLKVWKANPEFRMKDARFEDFKAAHDEFDQLVNAIAAKNRELDKLRAARDLAAAKLNQLCLRGRNGMMSYFGPGSSQYEQANATITIERKKRGRPAKSAAAK